MRRKAITIVAGAAALGLAATAIAAGGQDD
jgi:hypothetical protein